MKNKILSIFFTLLTGICFSQTIIPGGTVSGTWTQANSPYLIQGAIMIANGTTLTIDAGVHVEFQGSYKLLVLGQLLTIGSVTDSIVFIAADTAIGWLGIRFDNTAASNDTSKFYYCKFQYGKAIPPNGGGGAFYFSNFSKAIISNSEISNCYSQGPGGGIYLNNSSPVICYNNIADNMSTSKGGGIYCGSGNPIISFTIFTNNIAMGIPEGGGAICCLYGSPVISNNLISNNMASIFGGGIYCYGSTSTISNNIISYNSATSGGGIFSQSGMNGPNVIYNIISNNSAAADGGGLVCENCDISNSEIINNTAINGGGIFYTSQLNQLITNTTISNNIAQQGGALYCSFSSPNLLNCILWNDSATISGNEIFLEDEPSDPYISYCDVQGGPSSFGVNANVFYTGIYTNNIDSNPQLTAPSGGCGIGFDGVIADWSLQGISPCINAGDSTGMYPATDLAGNPRIYDTIIDIGAYEYQITIGLDEAIGSNPVSIYPNPAHTYFTIKFDSESIKVKIEVTNMFGQHVLKENITYPSDGKIYLKPARPGGGNISSGIYFVKVFEGEKSFCNKLIIE